MLDFVDLKQNSEEWSKLRATRITSSNAPKIMANYGKAFGPPAQKLAASIAVSRLGGTVDENYTNEHMERGHAQEPIARMLYEDKTFCDVLNGGFYFNNDVGCSPDGRVGDEGIIEIKSVIPHVHYSNIKRGSIDPAYKWQCVANLFYTDAKWLDFISYCDGFPEDKKIFIFRMHRNHYKEEFEMIVSRYKEFISYINKVVSIIDGAIYEKSSFDN